MLLISDFNAQYTLYAPKLEDLSSLPDDDFVNFFFDWILNCKLLSKLFLCVEKTQKLLKE